MNPQEAVSYLLLAELDSCAAHQISIESPQQNVDMSILRQLPDKMVIVDVLTSPTMPPSSQLRLRVVTCLQGRSERTRGLAADAGIEDFPGLRHTSRAGVDRPVGGSALPAVLDSDRLTDSVKPGTFTDRRP